MKLRFLIVIGLLIIRANFAYAAGIEVSPAKLDIDAKKTSVELIVANPTADVQIFQVYADDFEDQIKLSPQSFTLESGARKVVVVTIAASFANLKQDGVFATNISIIGKPLAEGTFSVATGVKVPITVNLMPQAKTTDHNKALWFGAFVVLLIAAVIYSNRTIKK